MEDHELFWSRVLLVFCTGLFSFSIRVIIASENAKYSIPFPFIFGTILCILNVNPLHVWQNSEIKTSAPGSLFWGIFISEG